MSALVWDKSGTRKFEAGVDRGVLFLYDGSAVAWNGLTACSEDPADINVEEYYLDGLKYLNRRTPNDYSGTLKALTYPDEFLPFDGLQAADDGIFVTGQSVRNTFGLSYRTRVGNDQSGADLGYKLHVLYNLTAKPDSRTYSTMAATSTAEEFSWTLSGVPVAVPGMRPAVHFIIDSTKVFNGAMLIFENALYGTATAPGKLPDAPVLVKMLYDTISDPITEPI